MRRTQLQLKSSEIFQTFSRCIKLLSIRDRYFLIIFALLNLSLSLLEVFAVVLVGVAVSTATAVIQSKEVPVLIYEIVDSMPVLNSSPQTVVGVLGFCVAALLIAKSALSYFLSKRNFAFLSKREPLVGEAFSKTVFTRTLDEVNQFSPSDYQHAMTLGCNSVIIGVIGGTALLSGEIILQLLMSITLFIYSPILMLACMTILMVIFMVLYKSQGARANQIGRSITITHIDIFNTISNLVNSYRDIYTLNKQSESIERLKKLKLELAKFEVQSQLLKFVAKYVFDIAIVVLAILIGLYSFITKDAAGGLATIAVFIAAISRMAPSVLRVQQGLVSIRGSIGSTKKFFEILEFNPHKPLIELEEAPRSNGLDSRDGKGEAAVVLQDVSLTYLSRRRPSLSKVSLKIPNGETWAIVGKSGSGKSSLVDIILGLNLPDSGSVKLFGKSPRSAISDELIQIGYVPQQVNILNKTILENVSFEEISETNFNQVRKCLRRVGLDSWVKNLPKREETLLGDNGSQLSGGQKQRLGIARAIYRNPDLLILDEATSSLDADSENSILDLLKSLHGKTTIIIIAHRLSTVQHADCIVYMKNGRVEGLGTFSNLRKSVMDFDRQAKLLGLH